MVIGWLTNQMVSRSSIPPIVSFVWQHICSELRVFRIVVYWIEGKSDSDGWLRETDMRMNEQDSYHDSF